MKILQINDDYQRLGGAETYFFNLIELLQKKGHQVFVFTIRGKNTSLPENATHYALQAGEVARCAPHPTWCWGRDSSDGGGIGKNLGSNTLVVGASKGLLPQYFSSKIFNFNVYFNLKKFITQIKPDIIHLHNNYLAPFSVLLAIRGHQAIQTVHDYKIICPYGEMIKKNNLKVCRGNIGLKCLKNECLSFHNLLTSYWPFKLRMSVTKKIIDKFISPSKKLKQYLENFGFQNVHHLPYFLEVENYQSKDTPASGPPVGGTLPEWTRKKDSDILYLGRLVKTKGIDSLFRALPKVISKVSQTNLTIVGDGPQKDYLIFLAKKLKIADRVNFAGRIPHRQVKKYYQQANVVVVPSLCLDNSPNVVYEALSAGRPVVASNRGGMSDFVKNNQTGFIFKSGNPEDLAEKIIIILKNDKLFRKMSFNGRQFALDNFTPEKHYQKIMRLYQNKLSL